MAYIPTLKTKYNEEILPALMKEYGYKTVMQAPRLKKITLNQGLGKAAIADKKVIDKGIEEMSLIAGQKAGYQVPQGYFKLQTTPWHAYRSPRNPPW